MVKRWSSVREVQTLFDGNRIDDDTWRIMLLDHHHLILLPVLTVPCLKYGYKHFEAGPVSVH